MEKYLVEFLKESIIREFENRYVFYTGSEGVFLRGLSQPVLTMCDVEGCEEVKKFALCNIAMIDTELRNTHKYNITGLISTLNGGRIVISNYELQ